MSTLSAISLHAPWGIAIAHGLKRWETRSWPCPPRYIGQTIAIHQAKRRPEEWDEFGSWRVVRAVDGRAGRRYFLEPTEDGEGLGLRAAHGLPLGSIVATARIVASVPCLGVDDELPTPWMNHVAPARKGELWHWKGENESAPTSRWAVADISDQRPWGDFTPGRWAWQLDQIQPLAVPVPAVGRQGVWHLSADVSTALVRS